MPAATNITIPYWTAAKGASNIPNIQEVTATSGRRNISSSQVGAGATDADASSHV